MTKTMKEVMEDSKMTKSLKKALDKSNHPFTCMLADDETDPSEEWRPLYIDEEETVYNVSNFGRVRNMHNGNLVRSFIDQKGYVRAPIYHKRKSVPKAMHRLVAQTFIPNPENKAQVNHINGVKRDNRVENLEWNTPKENINHSYDSGNYKIRLGSMANASKYNEEEVHHVCRLLEEGKLNQRQIAEETGVDVLSVYSIKARNCWKQITSQYNIPEPNGIQTGEASPSSKYTEEQIRDVCELLTDADHSYRIISEATGVGWDIVWRVANKKNWKEVSDDYDIPPRNTHRPKPHKAVVNSLIKVPVLPGKETRSE